MFITPLGEQPKNQCFVTLVKQPFEATILVQNLVLSLKQTDRIFSIFCSDYTQTLLVPQRLENSRQTRKVQPFSSLAQVAKRTHMSNSNKGQKPDLLIIPSDFMSTENIPATFTHEKNFVCVSGAQQDCSGRIDCRKIRRAGARPNADQSNQKDFFGTLFAQKYGIKRHVIPPLLQLCSLHLVIRFRKYRYYPREISDQKNGQVWPLKILPLPLIFRNEAMLQCISTEIIDEGLFGYEIQIKKKRRSNMDVE